MADVSGSATVSPLRAKFVALAPAVFGGAAFASAALVFLVEPMITRLVLPMLGGSPAVWNTCLVFFQAMLLAGYAYAHLLQRLSPRAQAFAHAALLAIAALFLPLRVSDLFGPPPAAHPIPWLLGVLGASLGLPFFALSATAPLIQAWYTRVRADETGPRANPYVLYAASNLGSLLALLAYPTVVEPLLRLDAQRLAWSAGFALFALALAAAGVGAGAFAALPRRAAAAEQAAHTPWRERAMWMALAAIPSSLMTGVTTYISTDVASAPFLWIAPLALYLATFIVAFQTRPWIPREAAMAPQAALLAACAFTIQMPLIFFPLQMALHLLGFFFAALVCHQALAARRPGEDRLTEFYLFMSIGGLLGGMFNALIAPAIFNAVLEYPLALALAALVRPWGEGALTTRERVHCIYGAMAGIAALAFAQFGEFDLFGKIAIGAVLISAFMLRNRAPLFCALIAVTLAATAIAADKKEKAFLSERSFFGVLRLIREEATRLGPVTIMAHGTTMHGAQAEAPAHRCTPLTYYARATPIGQAFLALQAEKPALRIGAIGMGSGAVAADVRPGDRLRFYEIDPLVVRMAGDPRRFTYINGCAKGHVDSVLGDARLSLARDPPGLYDLLLVDAFSSDSIPAHLLTLEAIRLYLDHTAPGGVVVMHLSNRHLDLIRPVLATAQAAGAAAKLQRFQRNGEPMVESVDAVVLARDPAALARFTGAAGWGVLDVDRRYVWTDDHTNLFGALLRGLPEAL
ncbi:MAG: spermidine synthase [Hyphomonadaceae bacterium]